MRIKRRHIIFGILGLFLMFIDLILFRQTPWIVPIFIVAIVLGISQFLIDLVVQSQRKREMEERFPDFIRNLVGAIKSGMPAPKAITHIAREDYGVLTPYIKKLSNQIEWSVPLHKALTTFARATKNKVIERAIETVIEAEKAGGNIEEVLESITNSVIKIKKMKEQRRAEISSQILQTYIIFGIFLAVMVIIQNFLMPYIAGMQTTIPLGGEEEAFELAETQVSQLLNAVKINFATPQLFFRSIGQWLMSLRGVFIMIALIQALFAGLVLGKLSEGDMSSGFKHSIVLVIIGLLIMTISQGLL